MTDKRHSHNRYPDDIYPRAAEEDDARLQPDPELALSEGKASRAQIIMVALAALVVLGLVLYGITQPPKDAQTVAAPTPTQTTGAAPSAEQAPAQEQSKPGPSDSAR